MAATLAGVALHCATRNRGGHVEGCRRSMLASEGYRVVCCEKPDQAVSKPGRFPLFFGKGPDCVADPFGTIPRRCCY